ncbi:hypothetical protein GDO81_002796 [Engystomops pustulosus]|uniref:Peptidase S1 domain-containing protein n=1 Tax=Engystomops pustulosus TaxID=76066 RepID=A0AAV7DQI5_ENGPU|nr:hypothetical protein GDO81_002796 [Engystomops pustulosus]
MALVSPHLSAGSQGSRTMRTYWNVLLLAMIMQDGKCEAADIIGGKEAPSTPYMALVRTGKTFCGGALIMSDWVLTSAECIT